MKDSEFIELLNLYLDHEITAADAARLEAEVQGNLARRRIYEDYCRMAKGCKMLAVDFQTEPAAAAAEDRKVIDFRTAAQPARASGFYTIGAFAAAAACVAIVFVGRNREQAPSLDTAPTFAQVAPAPASPAVVPVARTSAEVKAVAVSTVTTRDAAALTGRRSLMDDAQLEAATAQANAQFAWMQGFQLAPLPQPLSTEEMRLDARPASLRTEPRMSRDRNTGEATVEMTAFRFQR